MIVAIVVAFMKKIIKLKGKGGGTIAIDYNPHSADFSFKFLAELYIIESFNIIYLIIVSGAKCKIYLGVCVKI